MAGRPRKRPVEESLDMALRTFWERGYAETSVRDLCDTLGVGPSSLYNAFGSKEDLFARCLERYSERESAFMVEALAQPHVIQALAQLLREAVSVYTRPDAPGGCAILGASVHEPGAAEIVRELRRSSHAALRARVERGVAEGQLPARTDVDGLVGFIFATLTGMSQQARDGASARVLSAVAERAIQAL